MSAGGAEREARKLALWFAKEYMEPKRAPTNCLAHMSEHIERMLIKFAARCANEKLDTLTRELKELAEQTYTPGAPGHIDFKKGLCTAYAVAAGKAQAMKGKE